MKIKDLKAGDKVFIREDLEHEKLYQDTMYIEEMGSGIMTISSKSRMAGGGVRVSVLGDEFSFAYSEEMIDWEKTKRLNNIKNSNRMENINTTDLAKEYLNSKFGYLNTNKDVVNENIFKEITQFGESGNEITKAVTDDGKEIIIKNNNEKNDVEKAVMLLMLKSLGVTYSEIKKEVEKVKVKWIPTIGEQFYYISTTPTLKARALTYFTEGALKEMTDAGNYFRTKEDAEEKIEKIKEVLRGEK